MKLRPALCALAALLCFAAGIFSVAAQPANAAPPAGPLASAPVYMPDYTHSGEPLPDGVLAWDSLLKAVDVTNGQDFARFAFTFTNVTGSNVTVVMVHPSCGCTTAELPPVPWTLPPGTNGEIKLKVDLANKQGTLFKQVNIVTDHGNKNLMLRINILPAPPAPEMTGAQRDAGILAAKADRQAVFKSDCASCHLKKVEGKYGQQLFDAICAICHESPRRATMVPDLHNLQVPTNEEFWRTWITAGKAGSLMPAFATSQGGPLNDLQIASLAAYLNAVIPSHVPQAPAR